MRRIALAHYQERHTEAFVGQRIGTAFERRPDFVQPYIALHVREIVLRAARERLEDGATQVRFVLGQGVQYADVRIAAGDEWCRTRFEQAFAGECIAQLRRDGPERRVARGARPVRTNLVGERIVPVQSRDLFDQIHLGHEIAAPRWRDDVNGGARVVHVGGASKGLEELRNAVGRQRHAEHARDPRGAQDDRGAGGVARVQIHRRRSHFPAGERNDQRRDARERTRRQRHVHTALEPVARVGREPHRATSAPRAPGVERGNLDEEVRRPVVNFRGPATHYARERNWIGRIGDDGDVRRERSRHAVERDERLTLFRRPNDDGLFRHRGLGIHLREIERVRRLAKLVQHVVRGVHDVVDRTRAHCREPVHKPLRARPDLHAANDDAHVAGGKLRVFQMQDDATRVAGSAEAPCLRDRDASDADVGKMQVATRHRRDFTRDAEVREQIGAIRQHVDHQARITHRHRAQECRARLHIHVEFHDALVLLA